MRSLSRAALHGWEQSSKQRVGWIHRFPFSPKPRRSDRHLVAARMQKATDSKAQERSETREQWSKLPSSSLLKAWLDWQEGETQIKLQTCKAGRAFPAGRFPHQARPMVLWGQRDCCLVCSNSCFPLPMDLDAGKDMLDPQMKRSSILQRAGIRSRC